MIVFNLLQIACAIGTVFGQYPNGLYFTNANTITQPAYPTSPSSSPTCSCVAVGTCPTGSPGIDIRIVNTGTSTSCPAGYVWCCSGGTSGQLNAGPCGIRKIPATAQTVVGQASFGAYPWQAALLDQNQAFVGSGVLLDPTHVLTAAHKVASFVNNPNGILVRLGEWNAQSTSEPYQWVQVSVVSITIHPSFNPNNLENDVAVVRLASYINVASYPNVNTACRPTTPPITGSRCWVSGWGKNLFGPNGSYQSIMREVDVPILDGNDCENRLKQTRLGAAFVLNKNSFLCAGGEPGKDACTGDGGSPLVCQTSSGQFQLYGMVAWGIGCAIQGVPGVYTNVYNYLTWISQVIAATP